MRFVALTLSGYVSQSYCAIEVVSDHSSLIFSWREIFSVFHILLSLESCPAAIRNLLLISGSDITSVADITPYSDITAFLISPLENYL